MTLANSFPMEFDVTFNQNELDGQAVDTDAASGSVLRERLLLSIGRDTDSGIGLATGRLLGGDGVDVDAGSATLTRSRTLRSGPIPVPNDFPQTFPFTFEDDLASEDIDAGIGRLTRERELVGNVVDIDVGDGELTRIRTLVGVGDDPDAGSGEAVVIAERLRGESVAPGTERDISVATGERQIISVAQGSID